MEKTLIMKLDLPDPIGTQGHENVIRIDGDKALEENTWHKLEGIVTKENLKMERRETPVMIDKTKSITNNPQ